MGNLTLLPPQPQLSEKGITVAERRQTVARMYVRGKLQEEIGCELGITQKVVSADLKAIRDLWLASSVRDYNTALGRELLKIDQLEQTYWAEWDASKGEKTISESERTTAKTVSNRARVRKEQRDGNPTYLQGVQWCIQTRIKLLGLEAPTRTEADVRVSDGNAEKAETIEARIARYTTLYLPQGDPILGEYREGDAGPQAGGAEGDGP